VSDRWKLPMRKGSAGRRCPCIFDTQQECDIFSCTGDEQTAMATPTESVQEQHKAWLARMTTVLGEFCANSKGIAWMLELM
jgi:hypothetical protein